MAKRKVSDTVDLKVRMKEPLRQRLEKAALRRGISMNAEAVERLEQSFKSEDSIPAALAFKYGDKLAGLVLAMAALPPCLCC